MAAAVSAPSGEWTALLGNYDFRGDQKAGQADGDIVGLDEDYGLFVTYNSADADVSGQSTFGFRLRLDAAGGNSKKIEFKGAAWLGIDGDMNGSIDVFLGVNMSGSSRTLGIYSPGTGANNAPGSTSVSSTAYRTYTIGTSNYDYRPVSYKTDGGSTNDLTPTTTEDPDYYLSVLIPFEHIANALADVKIDITEKTPLNYVAATSTQGNSFNQDISGVDGGIDSPETWAQLGAFAPTITIEGTLVPEPGTAWFTLLSLSLLILRRRRV